MMKLFRKKQTLKESGFFRGFIDWHSHILPGVDDGVRSMDEALAILAEYESLGVKEVWLTPHIMEDIPNTTQGLRERFSDLKAAYKGSVELNLAAENMIDNLFEERLRENDLLPLGKEGNRLLVETSYFNPPINLHNTLMRIKAKGYFPVLAHPERYVYMDKDYYRRLKDMGIKFQLNYFSLLGKYGEGAGKKAEYLQKHGMYDCSGTDLHRLETLKKWVTQRVCVKRVHF